MSWWQWYEVLRLHTGGWWMWQTAMTWCWGLQEHWPWKWKQLLGPKNQETPSWEEPIRASKSTRGRECKCQTKAWHQINSSVLRALELCVDMWRQPLCTIDSNTRSPISLIGEVACEAPPSPDEWMLRKGSWRIVFQPSFLEVKEGIVLEYAT